MMKKLRSGLSWFWNHKKISLAIFLATGFLVYFIYPKGNTKIETVRVKRQKIIQTISASGSVNSETTVNLSFISGGKLTYVNAKKGDTVTAGQTIATLDQRTLKTNLVQALEDYSKQRNTFENVVEQNLNHTPADALSTTMKRVLEDNQNDLDKAVNSVSLQQLTLENSVLTSPIDGIVTRADAQVAGLNVTAATTFTIADPDNLVFNVEVDEADIGKIISGQELNVTFDAYPEHSVPLRVSSIDFASHTSNAGATVYTIKAPLLPDTINQYRIGMNGDAEIILAERKKTLTIPLSCLIDDTHLYVKTGNTFEKRKITTGLQSDTDIEIIRGLKEGEEVALVPEEVEKIIKNSK